MPKRFTHVWIDGVKRKVEIQGQRRPRKTPHPDVKYRFVDPDRRLIYDVLGYCAIPLPGRVEIMREEALKRHRDFLRVWDVPNMGELLDECNGWRQWDALVDYYGRQ